MSLAVGNGNVTRYNYIFLDRSGNFDFGNSGTCYLVLTSVLPRHDSVSEP